MNRRTASEVLRNLEARVARLEGRRTASADNSIEVRVTPRLKQAISNSIPIDPDVEHLSQVWVEANGVNNIELVVGMVSSFEGSYILTSRLDASPSEIGAVFALNGSIKAVDLQALTKFISKTKLRWSQPDTDL